MEIIGLSISHCVLALANGKIPLQHVKRIIGDTACPDPREIWKEYSQTCWIDHSQKTRLIFFQLLKEGKIDQPRLRNEIPLPFKREIWQVGDLFLSTEALEEMIEVSDSFLKISDEERNSFFDFLPTTAYKRLMKNLKETTLKKLFPGIDALARTLPVEQLHNMIKDRLKQYYRNALEFEQLAMYPMVMNILTPFIKRKISKEKKPDSLIKNKNPKLSRFMKPIGS